MQFDVEVTFAPLSGAGWRRALSTTFHRRCASALVHPVTLAALALLLINDLVLKALWPNPWTTGKLSDLAWIAFAPPMLAFVLSLATRRRPAAQRAAFVVAYAGLPALYAAFNTFAPLHDLIIGLLTRASGASAGSPLDPADSLVIPFGLGMALWVWTRPLAPQGSLRMRLGLLTLSITALATVATAPDDPPPNGLVGKLDDENLILSMRDPHVSADGGLTWRASSWHEVESAHPEFASLFPWDDGKLFERSTSVTTPRGVYVIEGRRIIREFAGGRRSVFAPLEDRSDARFQGYLDERDGCRYRCPSWSPLNVVYDVRTGNVVVALGTHGVAVGDEGGNWTHVAVNQDHGPRIFALGDKLRGLFNDPALWLTATALAVAAAAAALTLSQAAARIYRDHFDAYGIGSMIGIPALALASCIGLLIAWLPLRLLLTSTFWDVDVEAPYVILAVIIVLAVTYIPLAITIVITKDGIVFGIGSAFFSVAAAAIAITALFVPINAGGDAIGSVPETAAVVGLIFGITALSTLLSIRSPSRQLLISVAVAVAGMTGLVALAFLIGVAQDFNLGAAKLYAIALVAVAAFTLAWRLRDLQSGGNLPDKPL